MGAPLSTAAKIKRLVKPLLKRNPDLVLVGKDTLWLHPIHKFGRHIHFRRGKSQYFTLSWHLSALFTPALWIAPHPGCFDDGIGRSSLRPSIYPPLRRGPEIYRTHTIYLSSGTGIWEYGDNKLQDDLILQVEKSLRLMRSLDTLETCLAFLRSYSITRMGQIEHWPMILDLTAGDLDAARETWLSARKGHRPSAREEPMGFFERIEHRWSELDAPLMEKDRAGLGALLNRWESENVRSIGIENLWTPTSFPFEIEK
ncbi:hypothetical protein ACLBWX_17735 [Methylobacterium sp. M6A4_1b]